MSHDVFATKNEYLKSRLQSFSATPLVYECGKVSSVGDGVATVSGLKNRLYGELLEFDDADNKRLIEDFLDSLKSNGDIDA